MCSSQNTGGLEMGWRRPPGHCDYFKRKLVAGLLLKTQQDCDRTVSVTRAVELGTLQRAQGILGAPSWRPGKMPPLVDVMLWLFN